MPRLENELSDDDLDELVSDEEDVKPSDSTIGQILKGTLDEPRFKSVNMRYLNGAIDSCGAHVVIGQKLTTELIQTDAVNLNPDYQRDVVWTDARQIKLIQSLMQVRPPHPQRVLTPQHYYVPPVIFAVEMNEEKGIEMRICIDGKQRCTSVQRFIQGQIPFISPNTREKFWYTPYPGQKGGKPLPEVLKMRFNQLNIQVVEYRHLDLNQQRDIFREARPSLFSKLTRRARPARYAALRCREAAGARWSLVDMDHAA